MQKRNARLKRLKKQWGFHCACALCQAKDTLADAADDRMDQIRELRKEFSDYTTGSRATPTMAELMISLYRQERLDSYMHEAYTLAALEYNGVGEPWMATKYARLAIEHGLISLGEYDNDVSAMTNLARDPWAHWSWMLRTKKRMSWGSKSREEEDSDDE
jgi:hypothetical protein